MTSNRILIPQNTSAVGMTAAAIGGTIDHIGAPLYLLSLALSVANSVLPNPHNRWWRRPEMASHLMLGGAAFNTIENVKLIIEHPTATAATLATYWGLAGYAHYRTGILQANSNKPKLDRPGLLATVAQNPGNVYVPMNALLAVIPMFITDGALPALATGGIALSLCTAAAGYQIRRTRLAHRGDITLQAVNNGRVNQLNMGVCAATAIAFGMAGSPFMTAAALAFMGTNYLFYRMFKPKAAALAIA